MWFSKSSKERDEICRLCLSTEVCMHPLFTEGETSSRLRSRILDCCPVELLEDDVLPKMICAECEVKVLAAFEFREQCRDSERKLRQSYKSCYHGTRGRYKPFRDAHTQTEALVRSSSPIEVVASSEKNEKKKLKPHPENSNILEGEKGENLEEKTPEQQDPKKSCSVVKASSTTTEPAIDGAEGATLETEKRYLCDICSKTFASKSGLRFHLKAHEGSKPHLCRHCGKGFAIPSYARRHEKIHTGDKRFVCHVCSASFASSNGFKYHLRSHTGEANYRCETCGKSFGRYKYLKEHIFTHTGEKPFACKTCGSAYGNSGSLFVHEKKCRLRFAHGN